MTAGIDGAVGIVGVGRIGGGVARRLHRCGLRTLGFDIRSELVMALAPEMTAAATPRELGASADVVLVLV